MRARGRAARARFATEHELVIAPSHVKNKTGARRDHRELFRLLRDSRPGDALSVTDAVQLHRLTDVGRPTPRAEIDARQIRVAALDRPTSRQLLSAAGGDGRGQVQGHRGGRHAQRRHRFNARCEAVLVVDPAAAARGRSTIANVSARQRQSFVAPA